MNILLSFLSTVNTNKEGKVSKADYSEITQDGLGETHTTNESGLRYVLQNIPKGQKLDAFVALESKAFSKNTVGILNKTHEQYFEERLHEICAAPYYKDMQLDPVDLLKYVSYNENGTIEDSIRTVSEAVSMIGRIKEKENVALYLDISGGLRDASMLLLITSRILEHLDGVRVSKIVYSNFERGENNKPGKGTIQERHEVYEMLDLVAAVQEFIDFGSVKSLNKYFSNNEKEIGPELNRALDSMKEFSEKIQLCHSNTFDEAIDTLHSSLTEFKRAYNSRKQEDIGISEKLFFDMYESIWEKYKGLFAEGKTSSGRIVSRFHWCIDNGYLQQSITLINEQAPFVFFDECKPVIRFYEDEIKDSTYQLWKKWSESLKQKKDYLEFPVWFTTNCKYGQVDSDKESFKAELDDLLRDVKDRVEKGSFTEQYSEKLKSSLIELQKTNKDIKQKEFNAQKKNGHVKSDTSGKKIKYYANASQMFKGINSVLKEDVIKQISMNKADKIDTDKISRQIEGSDGINARAKYCGKVDTKQLREKVEQVKEFWNKGCPKVENELPVMELLRSKKDDPGFKEWANNKAPKELSDCLFLFGISFEVYPNGAQKMLDLLRKDVVVNGSEYSFDEVIDIIKTYYEIKEERNTANHAGMNRDKTTSYNDLVNMLNRFVNYLDRVVE